MRFPNLRYGNPTEFNFYAMGRPLKELARQLRRDERTIRDWLSGRARVPWWVPEILRLKRMEAEHMYRQMFWKLPENQRPVYTRLGVVADDGALQPAGSPKAKTPQLVELRRDDVDQVAPASRQVR